MLRKYYEYIGGRYTLAGEVPQQTRYIGRRYTSPGEGAPMPVRAVPARVYIGADELEAGYI